MLKENEVVMLILGIFVLVFVLMSMDHIKKINSWKILAGSYLLLLTGWFFTVLEGVVWERLLNFSEHICYVLSAALLISWCWKFTTRTNQENTA